MSLISRVTARLVVFKFLSWAERCGLLYSSERPWVSNTLIPTVAAFIELMLGHDVDSEVEVELKKERRRRVIVDILRKH